MAKDRRRKGCQNPNCERHRNKVKYNATDQFCTICGEPLIYVCSRCHSEISDEGLDHKMCDRCEAIIADRKEQVKKVAKRTKDVAIGVAAIAPAAATRLKDVNPKDMKSVAKAAGGVITEVGKKIKR